MFIINPSEVVDLITAFGAAATPEKPINPAFLIGVLTGMGLLFGFLLSYADKRIAVKLNPLIHEVDEVLPKGQCGACGFPGCAQYAENVVENPDVAPNLCIPGGSAVADLVARLTGKKAEAVEPRTAVLMCRGDADIALAKYHYDGVRDCRAADLLFKGSKACEYGCLGFGNCVLACKFGAMVMGANGLPIIDQQKCVGCGACAEACPRAVIAMVPKHAKVAIFCKSHEKAGVVRKQCAVGCLGCGLCAKFCDKGAVKMDNFLPIVDYAICKDCDTKSCLTDKCKTGAIIDLGKLS